jgi:hypothetical protein
MMGPLVDNKSQASRAATEASRRNSRFGPPWFSAPCSVHLRCVTPVCWSRMTSRLSVRPGTGPIYSPQTVSRGGCVGEDKRSKRRDIITLQTACGGAGSEVSRLRSTAWSTQTTDVVKSPQFQYEATPPIGTDARANPCAGLRSTRNGRGSPGRCSRQRAGRRRRAVLPAGYGDEAIHVNVGASVPRDCFASLAIASRLTPARGPAIAKSPGRR